MASDRLTMTIPEFAETMGCSKNLAFRLARQNLLPISTIFIGTKRMVVAKVAVDKLLAGNGSSGDKGSEHD